VSETIAVTSHDDGVLQDDPVAEATELPHHGVRMSQEIVADLGAFVEGHVGVNDSASPEDDALPNYGVGTNTCVRPVFALSATTAVGWIPVAGLGDS
jgi:hypothetical protein